METSLEKLRMVLEIPLQIAFQEATYAAEEGRKPEEVVIHLTYEEACFVKRLLA